MAIPGTTLFDQNNFELFKKVIDQTAPYDETDVTRRRYASQTRVWWC